MPDLAEKTFDVGDFEILLEDEDQPLRYSQIENLTVNYDTNEGDGIGGTVVFRSRKKHQRGFYSGAPVTEIKWFEFPESSDGLVRELCKKLSNFDIQINEKHFVNSLFKKVYLNLRD